MLGGGVCGSASKAGSASTSRAQASAMATSDAGEHGRELSSSAGGARETGAAGCGELPSGTGLGEAVGSRSGIGRRRGSGGSGRRGGWCVTVVALVLLAFLPAHECASYAGAYKWMGTVSSPPDVATQKACDGMLLSETYQTIEMGSTDLEMRAGYSAPTKYGPGLIDEEPLALAYSSFTGHMTGQNIFEGTFHGQAKCTGQFSSSQAFLHCWLHPMSPSHCLITLECYAGPCYDPLRFPQFDNDYDSNGVRRKHALPPGAAAEGGIMEAGGGSSRMVGGRLMRKPPSLVAKVGRFWRYRMGGWRGTSVVAMLLVAGSLVGYSFRELQRNKMSRESSVSSLDGYWTSLPTKEVAFRPSSVDELPFDTV